MLHAGNGVDALAIAERHPGPIDLLVTDVVMPRMSGPELSRQLESLRPSMAVLFMSGYSDSRLLSHGEGVRQAKAQLLSKPFTPEQLLESVRNLSV